MAVTIDGQTLDGYDIARYLVEHRGARGELAVQPDGLLTFTGFVASGGIFPAQQLTVSLRVASMGT